MTNTEHLLRQEFQLQTGLIYLNHAAVSPWPRRTADAVKKFADENLTVGSMHYLEWIKTETALRQKMQYLINAPKLEDIALLKSTSEALSVVAYGLDWRRGDNIVISDQEFPSNRVVWESLQSHGVEVRKAVIDMQSNTPEQALIAACDHRTRLLSISSIQYATGFRLDLETLGYYCRMNDILFCIDAIQSIGAVTFDVQTIGADFVMADGHKWMMGPEGLALFYCAEQHRDRLKLHQYGWHMLEHMTEYDKLDWRPSETARRFECGSPNMLGIHALNASLSLLLEVGMAEVEAKVIERAELMMEGINEAANLELVTPDTPGRYGGIVSFKHKTLKAEQCHQLLTAQHVICAARGGYIRYSPHCYTSPVAIAEALERANHLKLV